MSQNWPVRPVQLKENFAFTQHCPARSVYSTHHNDKILAETLTESLFHFQNDWSGCTLLTLCPKSARSLHQCIDGLPSN